MRKCSNPGWINDRNVCLMNTSITPSQASEFCAARNMTLFTARIEEDLQNLFEMISDEFYGLPGSHQVLINGEFVNNVWSTSNPTAPLLPAAYPSSSSGNCLFATNNYTIVGASCEGSKILCEYPVETSLINTYLYCNMLGNITSSVTESYIKTACHVEEYVKALEAYQFCESHGMTLYTIQAEDELRDLYKFTRTRVDWMNFLLINGIYVDGVWKVNNQPAPQVSSVYTPQSSEGCLFVSGSSSTAGKECDSYNGGFMCEFVDTPSAASTSK